jgi:hypothetical protein
MADPATLRNNARCFDCEIPEGMFLAVMAYILQQTIDGLPVSADPATLANNARCYDCVGVTPGMIIDLLVMLNVSGGGGTTAQISNGAGDPVAAPTNPAVTNLYVNDLTGTIWEWPAGGAAWVQRV